MSDYYLADVKAEERERQRRSASEAPREPKESQNMKVTLLGDFLFPSGEPRLRPVQFHAWKIRPRSMANAARPPLK